MRLQRIPYTLYFGFLCCKIISCKQADQQEPIELLQENQNKPVTQSEYIVLENHRLFFENLGPNDYFKNDSKMLVKSKSTNELQTFSPTTKLSPTQSVALEIEKEILPDNNPEIKKTKIAVSSDGDIILPKVFIEKLSSENQAIYKAEHNPIPDPLPTKWPKEIFERKIDHIGHMTKQQKQELYDQHDYTLSKISQIRSHQSETLDKMNMNHKQRDLIMDDFDENLIEINRAEGKLIDEMHKSKLSKEDLVLQVRKFEIDCREGLNQKVIKLNWLKNQHLSPIELQDELRNFDSQQIWLLQFESNKRLRMALEGKTPLERHLAETEMYRYQAQVRMEEQQLEHKLQLEGFPRPEIATIVENFRHNALDQFVKEPEVRRKGSRRQNTNEIPESMQEKMKKLRAVAAETIRKYEEQQNQLSLDAQIRLPNLEPSADQLVMEERVHQFAELHKVRDLEIEKLANQVEAKVEPTIIEHGIEQINGAFDELNEEVDQLWQENKNNLSAKVEIKKKIKNKLDNIVEKNKVQMKENLDEMQTPELIKQVDHLRTLDSIVQHAKEKAASKAVIKKLIEQIKKKRKLTDSTAKEKMVLKILKKKQHRYNKLAQAKLNNDRNSNRETNDDQADSDSFSDWLFERLMIPMKNDSLSESNENLQYAESIPKNWPKKELTLLLPPLKNRSSEEPNSDEFSPKSSETLDDISSLIISWLMGIDFEYANETLANYHDLETFLELLLDLESSEEKSNESSHEFDLDGSNMTPQTEIRVTNDTDDSHADELNHFSTLLDESENSTEIDHSRDDNPEKYVGKLNKNDHNDSPQSEYPRTVPDRVIDQMINLMREKQRNKTEQMKNRKDTPKVRLQKIKKKIMQWKKSRHLGTLRNYSDSANHTNEENNVTRFLRENLNQKQQPLPQITSTPTIKFSTPYEDQKLDKFGLREIYAESPNMSGLIENDIADETFQLAEIYKSNPKLNPVTLTTLSSSRMEEEFKKDEKFEKYSNLLKTENDRIFEEQDSKGGKSSYNESQILLEPTADKQVKGAKRHGKPVSKGEKSSYNKSPNFPEPKTDMQVKGAKRHGKPVSKGGKSSSNKSHNLPEPTADSPGRGANGYEKHVLKGAKLTSKKSQNFPESTANKQEIGSMGTGK